MRGVGATLVLGLVILTAGCSRNDEERAKQKARAAGQELKQELKQAGQELKHVGDEVRNGVKKAKEEVNQSTRDADRKR